MIGAHQGKVGQSREICQVDVTKRAEVQRGEELWPAERTKRNSTGLKHSV